MILQNALGKEKQVLFFLKSAWHAPYYQIEAWIKYKFNPEDMFLLIENDQIISILQAAKRVFSIQNKDCLVSVVEFALTDPEYSNHGYFKKLLEAYIKKCECNELLSLVKTSIPKPFLQQDFWMQSVTKVYTLSSEKVTYLPISRVRKYRPAFDLYPLYETFLSHFDSSIHLSRQEFENDLAYYAHAKRNVVLMYNKSYEPEGFAIYALHENKARIEVLVYLNSNAIESLFSSLSLICDTILIETSQFEVLEKLYPSIRSYEKNEILLRINNKKLFEHWLPVNADLFGHPSWDQLL